MLKRLGLYITKNRFNVLWIALVCALLPFLGFPTSWINVVLIAFITLRKGAKEGFFVVLWSALPAVALAVLGNYDFLLSIVVLRGLVVWLLAITLGRSASWSAVIQATTVLGLAMIALLHYSVADVSGMWLKQLTVFWQAMSESLKPNVSMEQSESMLRMISQFATGVLAVIFLGFDLLLILLARGWQAITVNPGGLAKELLQIRMGLIASAMLLVCIVLTLLGSTFATDALPLVLLPFVLSGLSLIHAKLLNKKEFKLPVLMGLYIALIFFVPYISILLAFLALLDSWFDFRSLRAVRV